MFCFFSLTHPEFFRLPSAELCPSLQKERGKDTVRWLARLTSLLGQGVSELKNHKKYFPCLRVFAGDSKFIVLLPLWRRQ